MSKVANVQKHARYEAMPCVTGVRQWLLWVFAFMVILSAEAKAENPTPDWVLVFQDEFSTSSFEGKKLKWNQKWNKIEYLNRNTADWRKHQSREDALVVPGKEKKTTFVRLKGVYGKYESQSNQDGKKESFACGCRRPSCFRLLGRQSARVWIGV